MPMLNAKAIAPKGASNTTPNEAIGSIARRIKTESVKSGSKLRRASLIPRLKQLAIKININVQPSSPNLAKVFNQ